MCGVSYRQITRSHRKFRTFTRDTREVGLLGGVAVTLVTYLEFELELGRLHTFERNVIEHKGETIQSSIVHYFVFDRTLLNILSLFDFERTHSSQ